MGTTLLVVSLLVTLSLALGGANLAHLHRIGLATSLRNGLEYLVERLGASRALVLYDEGQEQLAVKAAHGVEAEQVYTSAALSLRLLESVRQRAHPCLLIDAQAEQSDSWSLQVSEIESLLCVPFWNPKGQVCGLLYADRAGGKKPFDRQDLGRIMRFARRLEGALFRAQKLDSEEVRTPPRIAPVKLRDQKPDQATGRLAAPTGRSMVLMPFAKVEVLPPTRQAIVAGGEESSRLPDTFQWMARFARLEVETAVERYTALMEPAIMVVVGGLVAFMILATMMPMARILETAL